jgi:glucose-1-phosphate cytidylyltransferase
MCEEFRRILSEMKVAILAGGQGSRLAEETRVKSKAMVPVGDDPILWHLLKY